MFNVIYSLVVKTSLLLTLSWIQRRNWSSLSYSICGKIATRQELPHFIYRHNTVQRKDTITGKDSLILPRQSRLVLNIPVALSLSDDPGSRLKTDAPTCWSKGLSRWSAVSMDWLRFGSCFRFSIYFQLISVILGFLVGLKNCIVSQPTQAFYFERNRFERMVFRWHSIWSWDTARYRIFKLG